jgi:transcriptional regulator with PAS, ATPase and Fis domain
VISADEFVSVYLPRLRASVEALARADVEGFIALSRALGEQAASTGVPFAAMIADINFRKEAAVRSLVDDPHEMNYALLFLDKLMTCQVGAAAEAYYAASVPPGRPAARPTGAEAIDVFHGLVGHSPAMARVFAQIRRLAGTACPVLVLGETGTGKELVARAIHDAGPRRTGPFLALNCAALPRDLVESELFGHRRGAFSGATSEGLGLFRAAAGGTLLLDEITEMGPDLQAKLLRVLQERTVRPVGSVTEEGVDVRVIASTNRDPEEALRSLALRADLYYRLAASTVVLPPLRDRCEDIPALVAHRLAALASETDGDDGVTSSAMEALVAHAWPGNVRELFNVVEDAFTMTGGSTLDVVDLRLAAAPPYVTPLAPSAEAVPTFREHERSLIARALAVTQGNKARAAQQLGISRKSLYAKIARYGLVLAVVAPLVSPLHHRSAAPQRAGGVRERARVR